MRRLLASLAFLFVFLISAPLLRAQAQSSMTGVVTDASGALVPDTQVVLSNPHTNVTFTTKTDSKGTYRFANVPPGPGYTVTFTHDGFAATRIDNISLAVAVPR